MSRNHLIIGLGGTGGKIIRAFRRAIYEEFRDKVPKLRVRNSAGILEDKEHPVKIGYLYVDSSDELMDSNDPSWRVPGDSLQLGLPSQLLIRGANLLNVVENVSAFPNISPWIGLREQWRDILGDKVGEALGGQKRRLGRFLLACKAGGPGGLKAKIEHQVADLRKQTNDAAVTFHICCGLAGGTGSGSVVDVISQIRSDPAFAGDNYRVLVYALLPDEQPPAGWAKANYHANGYGALIEMNALAVGNYQPYDIAGSGNRLQFRSPDGTPNSPFNGCYVFSNENENGKVLNLDRDEVSQLVASFLFQKIVVVNDTNWGTDNLRKAENAENADGETNEAAPGTKIPERSKRFLTFGIKRLVIPEEEIREYLIYQFARQAVLQLQYNHWSDTQRGFLDEPVNEAFAQYVSDARNHEHWSVSDAHLCQEVGILPLELEAKWQPIEAEWNKVITSYVQVVMKSKDKAVAWMGTLTQMCEDFFAKRWRAKGVKEFFAIKASDTPAQASEIARRIEADLFEEWISGRRSMFDLGKLLAELQKVLREKAAYCNTKMEEFRALDENKRPGGLNDNIRKNNQTWANIGMLADMFGKRERVLQGQAENFKAIYAVRHRIEAWAYAAKLVEKIQQEVETLAATVATSVSLFTEMVNGDANQQMQNRFEGIKERIAARCKEEGAIDLNDQIIKFYKVEDVRKFNDRLMRDGDIQKRQATAVRKAILEKMGENPTLAKFHQRLDKGSLLDLLEKVCADEAKSAHNQIVAADPRAQRILGNNIVDKLYRDFSGNSMALRQYIKDVVDRAGLYLHFDGMEMQNTNPGAGPQSLVKDFAVIIPAGQDHPEFKQVIQEAFSNAHGVGISFIEGAKANEISIIGIANLFPLRYAKQVRFLRQKYDKRIESFERAKLEVHTEGDGKQFSPVFLVSGGDVSIFPLLLLGRAMKLIRDEEDPGTGDRDVCLVCRDERGRETTPEALGSSDDEIIERRDVALAYRLKEVIKKSLQNEYLRKEKREDIKTGFDSLLNEIAQKAPNARDPRRLAFREAIDEAEMLMESLS